MHTSQSASKTSFAYEEEQFPYFSSWPPYQQHPNGFRHLETPDRITTGNSGWQEVADFQPPFNTLERFVNDSKDDPYCSCLEQDSFERDGRLIQHQQGHSRTWDAPQTWRSQDRFGSPDETIMSSASGSGYYPDADLASSFEADLPWLAYPGIWPSSEAVCGASQGYPHQTLEMSKGSGIALREIQSYPDDDPESLLECKEPPTINVQADEGITCEYGQPEYSPECDVEDRFPMRHYDPEVDDTKASRSYDEDSDYKPPGIRTRKNTGTSRASGGRRNTLGSSRKIAKRATFRNRHSSHGQSSNVSMSMANILNGRTATPPTDDPERPFSCPLNPYGCLSTFTSKNEWKRHVTSQHICLGFWRCDMCQDIAKGPNDFNRKDLFIQHIRRMHAGTRTKAAEKIQAKSRRQTAAKNKSNPNRSTQAVDDCNEEFEKSLEHIRQRCWIQIRDAPTEITCAFCDKVFAGLWCTEEWLEHAGRHLAPKVKVKTGDTKNASEVSEPSVSSERWGRDPMLRQWLLKEGLVEQSPQCGRYVMVDKSVVSEAAHLRSLNVPHAMQPKTESDV